MKEEGEVEECKKRKGREGKGSGAERNRLTI